jgi:cysteine desulfurase/selenocysteine lyase
MSNIRQHEKETITYALSALHERYGNDITIHGPTDPEVRGTALSFKFKDVHPHDLSQVLDQSNICVRAGHHCAKPLMRLLGANATARASFYLYNSLDDVDALVNALEGAGDLFSL